jgi:hypothetical protein
MCIQAWGIFTLTTIFMALFREKIKTGISGVFPVGFKDEGHQISNNGVYLAAF